MPPISGLSSGTASSLNWSRETEPSQVEACGKGRLKLESEQFCLEEAFHVRWCLLRECFVRDKGRERIFEKLTIK